MMRGKTRTNPVTITAHVLRSGRSLYNMTKSNLNMFKGGQFNSLNNDKRKSVLRVVQLIKKKKDGSIKGHTCINGSKQRKYTPEDDASSLTVSTEALLFIAAINAAEEKNVATCNITGAFLKADIDEQVLIV